MPRLIMQCNDTIRSNTVLLCNAGGARACRSSPCTQQCHVQDTVQMLWRYASLSAMQEGDYPGRDIYIKARAAHRQATEQQSNSATRGLTHYYREAVNLCDQALEINPAIGPAYLTKAACHMHLHELQESAEAYKNALQHDLGYLHDASACALSLQCTMAAIMAKYCRACVAWENDFSPVHVLMQFFLMRVFLG